MDLTAEFKDEAAEAIKRIKIVVEVKSKHTLHTLQTDRSREFTSGNFGDYYVSLSIKRQLTMPYSPQKIGVVKLW